MFIGVEHTIARLMSLKMLPNLTCGSSNRVNRALMCKAVEGTGTYSDASGLSSLDGPGGEEDAKKREAKLRTGDVPV